MSEVRDPGPEAADKILDGLEEFVDPPAEVARKARRLRAHVEALRAKVDELEDLNDQLNTKLEALLPLAKPPTPSPNSSQDRV